MLKALICFVLILLPWACAWQGGVITPKGEESTIVNNVPVIHGYVTDYAEVLSDEEEEYLRQLCVRLENRTSTELVVVTVKHMSGDGVSNDKYLYPSVEIYSNELFNKNGFGKREKNNGVLFFVSTGERKTRIEVGYGLEGILPDGKCGRILDENAVPYFKDDNYAEGIKKTTEAIVKSIDGSVLGMLAVNNNVSADNYEISKEEIKEVIKETAEEKYKTDKQESLYDMKMMIPGFVVAVIVPTGILVCLIVVFTIIGLTLGYFGVFQIYEGFGNMLATVYMVMLCAIVIQLRLFRGGSGGSSGGGGFGGGSSGGGGASRGF